jgi:peptidyl-dipeptidase Dcp
VLRLAEIRARKAQLLGKEDFASWSMADQMAGAPAEAFAFMRRIAPSARARAEQEQADIQQVIDNEGGDFRAAAWDWLYYAEQVRRAKFAIDEAQLKPYFALERVLRDGVFWAATQLFGIRFVNALISRFITLTCRYGKLLTLTARELRCSTATISRGIAKAAGRGWAYLLNNPPCAQHPVIYNVCNYQKPKAGHSALLSWDEVITLFHEFGHTLHGLFASQKYASLSGTNTPRDFVEFPSQINEHWASEPQVFAHYARHYQTGEAMPEALRDSMFRAAKFNKGYDMSELLAAALLDMHWHSVRVDKLPRMSMRLKPRLCMRRIWILPPFRHAIAAAISRISSAAAMRQAITPICGPRCWRMTAISGLWSRVV